MSVQVTRREFLAVASAAGLGLGLAACAPNAPAPTATPHDVPKTEGGLNVQEMDDLHEKGVTAFVANIEANSKTFWPAKMPFKMEGDTKVFQITCQAVQW